MSAKKLGRFTAGLFVALGLAFGPILVSAGGEATAAVPHAAAVVAMAGQADWEWS